MLRMGGQQLRHKRVDMGGFMTAIQRIKDYWFEIVLLPGGSGCRKMKRFREMSG